MTDDMNGNVYILTNLSMPGLIKIGSTNDSIVDYRITDLWTTGVPEPFKLEAYTKSIQPIKLEKQIHHILDNYRVNKKREFFKISLEAVFEILRDNFPDISWIIGETYELIKKGYWIDTFKNTLDKLSYDVIEFENNAETKNWYGKSKYSEDNFRNKHKFDALKTQLKYLKDGIKRRDTIPKDFEYLNEDDKYMRKMLKDIQKEFQDFKDNI